VLAVPLALVVAGCGPSRHDLPTTSMESCSGRALVGLFGGPLSVAFVGPVLALLSEGFVFGHDGSLVGAGETERAGAVLPIRV